MVKGVPNQPNYHGGVFLFLLSMRGLCLMGDHHLNFSLFLFSTSVELVPRNVCPTETIMIFVSYVHFDGEFIYLKSFSVEKWTWAIFGVINGWTLRFWAFLWYSWDTLPSPWFVQNWIWEVRWTQEKFPRIQFFRNFSLSPLKMA